MFRKAILSSPILSIIPTIKAATPVSDEPKKPPLVRPSDLPVYEAPHADYVEYLEDKKNSQKSSYVRSLLAEPVSTVRQHAQVLWEQTEHVKNSVTDNYNEFQDRTAWIVKYLREEENKQQRYGAVAIGGLTGFIFGLRGGIIRRILYTTAGTGIMGSVCFPEETNAIGKDVQTQARHYINVAYNFCYGVKPGDPQLEVKFPELSFPKSFSEFIDMSVSMTSSAMKAVMPPPKDNTEKPTDKTT